MVEINDERVNIRPSGQRYKEKYVPCERCGIGRWVRLDKGIPRNKHCRKCALELNKESRIFGILESWENPERRLKVSEKYKGEGNPFYGKKHKESSLQLMQKPSIEVDIVPNFEWGYLAGIVLGDGCISKTNGGNYKIGVSSSITETVDKFYESVNNLGLHCTYEISKVNPASLKNSIVKNPSDIRYSAVLLSKTVYQWLRPCKCLDFHFIIPDIVYSNIEMLKGFLQGFYDAEGSVYLSKKGTSSQIESFSKHESNLRQIQKCLDMIGIKSSIIVRGDRFASRLTICNYRDRIKFRDLIGFRIQRKQDALNNMIKPLNVRHTIEEYLRCMDLVSKGIKYIEIEKMTNVNASTIGVWVFKQRSLNKNGSIPLVV